MGGSNRMPSINGIVDVQISRNTASVAQAGFGTALIVGESAATVFDENELVRTYTSAADMLTDGFLPTDPEYLAAVRFMGQKNKPQKFLVGLVTLGTSEEAVAYVGALTSGTVSVSVNGVNYSQDFVTDQATTMAALAAKIDADANVATATWDDGTATLTITSNTGDLHIVPVSNGDFTSAGVTLAASTSSWGAELAAINEVNSDWFALLPARYSHSDAIAAADFVQSNDRIMGITVWDSAAVTNSGTDLAAALDTGGYDNVMVHYHPNYGEHQAASSLGERLALPPGNGTFKFKTFSGTPVYSLSASQIAAARAKNVNVYVSYGGNAILTEGVSASGEFTDAIIGIAWLKARLTENVFQRLASNPKIPYSDVGFSIVESAIREVLAQAIRNGVILDDETLSVSVPKLVDIPTNDRALRNLPDVTFTARISGAVHFVTIRGTVSV